jgi:hypothetical protein
MSETKQTTLRQAENTVIVEGLLLENRLETTEVNDKTHGKIPAIRGEVDIEVAENEVHTVSFFMKSLKKDGTENGIFNSLTTVKDEYKSVASVGREDADKVRVTSGQIALNEYYGQDGKLKSFPQIKSNFINRLKESDEYNPRAEFEVEVFIHSVIDEFKNNEETGRAILKGYIPLFNGIVIPFNFPVIKDGSDYVKDNYETGQTAQIYGDVVNFKEVTRGEEEGAFGKPKERITTKTVREYIITGGSEPYDEENVKSYDATLIKKALTEREVYLEELKNKKKDNNSSDTSKTKGFDTKSSNKKATIDKKDLPF